MNVLKKIIDQNGATYEVTVAIEELAELIKELTKFIRSQTGVVTGNKINYSRKKIIEEIADVEICISALKIMFSIKDYELELFRQFKTHRLEVFYINKGVKK